MGDSKQHSSSEADGARPASYRADSASEDFATLRKVLGSTGCDGLSSKASDDADFALLRLEEQLEACNRERIDLDAQVQSLKAWEPENELREQLETLEKEIARLKSDRGMWHHEPYPASIPGPPPLDFDIEDEVGNVIVPRGTPHSASNDPHPPASSPETPCSICRSYGHFTHNHPEGYVNPMFGALDPASEPQAS